MPLSWTGNPAWEFPPMRHFLWVSGLAVQHIRRAGETEAQKRLQPIAFSGCQFRPSISLVVGLKGLNVGAHPSLSFLKRSPLYT